VGDGPTDVIADQSGAGGGVLAQVGDDGGALRWREDGSTFGVVLSAGPVFRLRAAGGIVW